jgi:hypothetical protein
MKPSVLLIAALVFIHPAMAQEPSPPLPSAMPPGIARVSPIVSAEQRLAHAQSSYGQSLGSLTVSSYWLSGRGYFRLGGQKSTPLLELSTGVGYVNSSFVSDTYLGGYRYDQGLFMIPAYIGLRYNLFEGQLGTAVWSHFVRGGAGPVVGMLTPIGLDFYESLNHVSFHWGLGGYAATGLEFTFDQTYSFFLQAGIDYTGFFHPVGGRTYFGGPSLAIGFGRLTP